MNMGYKHALAYLKYTEQILSQTPILGLSDLRRAVEDIEESLEKLEKLEKLEEAFLLIKMYEKETN